MYSLVRGTTAADAAAGGPDTAVRTSTRSRSLTGWLRGSRSGLFSSAVAVGEGAGFPELAAAHRAAGGRAGGGPDDHPGHSAYDDQDPGSQPPGHHIAEFTASKSSAGRRLGNIDWPPRHLPVSVLHDRTLCEPDPATRLRIGDRVNVLAPTSPEELETSVNGSGASHQPAGRDKASRAPIRE